MRHQKQYVNKMKELNRKNQHYFYSLQEISEKNPAKSISSISNSVKSGLRGFFLVFIVILLTKLLAYSVEESLMFNLGINDIVLSLWGFIIFSFVVFASNNKNK